MKEVVTDMMRYTFQYNQEEDFLEVRATGKMDDKAFPEVVETYWSILKEHGCHRSLIDYRNFVFTKSTLEIYIRPETVVEVGGTNLVKMAVIVESINKEYYFLETVYLNRGFRIKMFTDSEEAIRWL
jgi:hypothetical protein